MWIHALSVEIGSDSRLRTFAEENGLIEDTGAHRWCLRRYNDRLEVVDRALAGEPKHYIDIERVCAASKTMPMAKSGAFNQALGRSTKSIADCTAGWGGDGFRMAMQGYKVELVERVPFLALMLGEAVVHSTVLSKLSLIQALPPVVRHDDGCEFLRSEGNRFDCIYLDPMFPPKKKASALPNKNMRLLHDMLDEQTDSQALFDAAISSGARRIVVKRPDHAKPLSSMKHETFASKLVRFDTYLV